MMSRLTHFFFSLRKFFEIFVADFFADNINGGGYDAHTQTHLRQIVQATNLIQLRLTLFCFSFKVGPGTVIDYLSMRLTLSSDGILRIDNEEKIIAFLEAIKRGGKL